MATAFVCPKCGYSQLKTPERAGGAFACPRCRSVADLSADTRAREPLSPDMSRVAPRSGVFDADVFAALRRAPADSSRREASAAEENRTAFPERADARPSSPTVPSAGDADEPAAAIPKQPKNMFLGLMLTLMFGGFGVLYASIPGGILCTLMELTLYVLGALFGERVYPALAFVRVIYLMVTVAAISGHNNDVARKTARRKSGPQKREPFQSDGNTG